MILQKEIMKFNETAGIEFSETPPSSWCVRPEFHELDQKVLKKYWQFVASTDQLEKPGSYVAGDFCDEPYVVTRTESGELKAFLMSADIMRLNCCTVKVAPKKLFALIMRGLMVLMEN